MTFLDFKAWCDERSCDGLWGPNAAISCINALMVILRASRRKREQLWQEINKQFQIVETIVKPINVKIEAYLRGEMDENT